MIVLICPELRRDNLLRDVAPWQARAPLSAADVLLQHQAILQDGLAPEIFQLMLIYNNRIYYPNRTDVDCVDNPAEHAPAVSSILLSWDVLTCRRISSGSLGPQAVETMPFRGPILLKPPGFTPGDYGWPAVMTLAVPLPCHCRHYRLLYLPHQALPYHTGTRKVPGPDAYVLLTHNSRSMLAVGSTSCSM
jgi:hypothetical protein